MASERTPTGMALAAEGFEWALTVIGVGHGPNTGRTSHRLRVRTARGEKVIDLTLAELPARVAELEGLTMDDDVSLVKLAAFRQDQLDELDGEIAALQAKRLRLAREVKAIEKCAAMLDGQPAARTKIKRAASGESTSERVLEALKAGPQTKAALASTLGLSMAAVGITCGKLAIRGVVKRDGDTVRLAKVQKAA